MGNLLITVVLLPALAGLGLILTGRRISALAPAVAVLVGLANLALLAVLGASVLRGPEPTYFLEHYTGALGFDLLMRLGRPELLFLLSAGLVFLGVFLYAPWYFRSHPRAHAFFPLALMFLSAVNLLVLSDSLVSILIAWEVIGLSSFLLIAYGQDEEEQRRAARTALLNTLTGSALLVMGIAGLVGFSAYALNPSPGVDFVSRLGSTTVSELVSLLKGQDLVTLQAASPFVGAFLDLSLVLVVLGAASKAAVFPFTGWLARAMVAPTPVSALLHGAAMVSAGGWLIYRFHPLIALSPPAGRTLVLLGLITALGGAGLAFLQGGIKRLLAYSTLSQLGAVFALTGLGYPAAALVWLSLHGPAKAGLFLCSGALERAAGSLSLERIGIVHKPRSFALLGLLLALSVGGAPFIGVYWGKSLAGLNLTTPLGLLFVLYALLAGLYLGKFIRYAFYPLYPLPLDPAIALPLTIFLLLSLAGFTSSRLMALESASSPLHGLLSGVLVLAGLGAGIYLGAKPLPAPLLRLAEGGLGLEERLPLAVGRAYSWLSRLAEATDRLVIDGMVRLVGYGAVLLREAADLTDRLVVDGAVMLAARMWLGVRFVLRPIQSGYIQTYLFNIFVSMFLMMVLGALMTRNYLCNTLAVEGTALKQVCRSLGISPQEVGDQVLSPIKQEESPAPNQQAEEGEE